MKVVIVTGGFDPLHSGHIAYFNAAKELGDKLVVGLNSDAWLSRKKGRPFMSWYERSKIIQALKVVDFVIEFNDDDESARQAIVATRKLFPDAEIVFANGGDRGTTNTLEQDVQDSNLTFAFGVGGEHKMNSSSWILNRYRDWHFEMTERVWGNYKVIYQDSVKKVKILEILPHKSISLPYVCMLPLRISPSLPGTARSVLFLLIILLLYTLLILFSLPDDILYKKVGVSVVFGIKVSSKITLPFINLKCVNLY